MARLVVVFRGLKVGSRTIVAVLCRTTETGKASVMLFFFALFSIKLAEIGISSLRTRKHNSVSDGRRRKLA